MEILFMKPSIRLFAVNARPNCFGWPAAAIRFERDFYLGETAQATALACAAVPDQMADANSAPRCIFQQIVRERSRGTTWSHSGISCRKTIRGLRRLRDHRRGACDHRGASLSSIVAPQNGLFPPTPHDSRLSEIGRASCRER